MKAPLLEEIIRVEDRDVEDGVECDSHLWYKFGGDEMR